MTTTTTHPPCPRCGSADAVRILYGLRSTEGMEGAKRGEYVLGGCVIGLESPDFECPGCGGALPWLADDDEDD